MVYQTPPFRWVGRKTKDLDKIKYLIPDYINNFYELMCGSASLATSGLIDAKQYNLIDLNYNLITTLRTLKGDNLDKVISLFQDFKNNKKCYDRIRSLDRTLKPQYLSPELITARFIYLLNTNFQGMWRENKKGQMNVPFGHRKSKKFFDKDSMLKYQSMLNKHNTKIYHADFVDFVENIADFKENDFVYIDPPYIPISKTSSFTGYTNGGFELELHTMIRNIALDLAKKGVKVLISNSHCDKTFEIYQGLIFNEMIVDRKISAKVASRGQVKEFLISNY
jgi:DNA adenine methylase